MNMDAAIHRTSFRNESSEFGGVVVIIYFLLVQSNFF